MILNLIVTLKIDDQINSNSFYLKLPKYCYFRCVINSNKRDTFTFFYACYILKILSIFAFMEPLIWHQPTVLQELNVQA